jgi:hypothetical protein
MMFHVETILKTLPFYFLGLVMPIIVPAVHLHKQLAKLFGFTLNRYVARGEERPGNREMKK